jgi:CheY-like chemotaxis protein
MRRCNPRDAVIVCRRPKRLFGGVEVTYGVAVNGETSRSVATVLVVDDEAFIRLFLSELLLDAGLQVLEASDADEAVAILGGLGVIDLVLTDLNMPGSMNGLGLARFVRANRPETKVVFLSSEGLNPSLNRWGDAFLPKPCDCGKIVSTIDELLAAA